MLLSSPAWSVSSNCLVTPYHNIKKALKPAVRDTSPTLQEKENIWRQKRAREVIYQA